MSRRHDFLERFLAEQRAKMANRLIAPQYRQGRILDVGCGDQPFFLLKTQFSEKYGLDRLLQEESLGQWQKDGIILSKCDLEKQQTMPFADEYFDVVTMLAVFEHLEKGKLAAQLKEIWRVLKPGGLFVMTTPAAWADVILKTMSFLRAINSVLYEEHKDTYNFVKITAILETAGFVKEKMRLGYFELCMNIWATARK